MNSSDPKSPPTSLMTRVFSSVGPALVVACVCIGPGSILTSSKVGATHGYSKVWVVLASVVFMTTYTILATRLGVVAGRSAGSIIKERGGAPLAWLIGLLVCFIAAAYQFGNNLGVHAAINEYIPNRYWIVLFNAVALMFVFGFRDLYVVLERVMATLVAVMLLAFAINLYFARPDVAGVVQGLNPLGGDSEVGLALMGLVGTTFVISNAFYQSYLVRFKGWTIKDVRTGTLDVCVGTTTMALITLMIMCTAAAVFHVDATPESEGASIQLNSVADVGRQLEPFFGAPGQIVFSIGLFAAAFSSFVVNSMVGGFVLSDALGFGAMPEDRAPRVATAIVLLIGMGVALWMILADAGKPVGLIVAAQAATVLAAPLIAATLLWLTNLESVMGEHRNGWLINVLAATGLVVLLLISANIVINSLMPAISTWSRA